VKNQRVLWAACSVVFASAAALVGCSSASEDGTWLTPVDESSEIPESVGAADEEVELGVAKQPVLTGTHKVCSVFSSANWRDTILVPNGWAQSTCTSSWKNAVGAGDARVGCMVNNTVSLATCLICLPPVNSCGW
jgi:hypothetical protein